VTSTRLKKHLSKLKNIKISRKNKYFKEAAVFLAAPISCGFLKY